MPLQALARKYWDLGRSGSPIAVGKGGCWHQLNNQRAAISQTCEPQGGFAGGAPKCPRATRAACEQAEAIAWKSMGTLRQPDV
jgi:hypothetical protein